MKKLTVIFLMLLMLLTACASSKETATEEPTRSDIQLESIDTGLSEKKPDKKTKIVRPNDSTSKSSFDSLTRHHRSDAKIVLFHFETDGMKIHETLNDQDSEAIVDILTSQRSNSITPSCEFSDDIYFEVDGIRFAIAIDNSGYLMNCETGLFISLSEDSCDTIEQICDQYGAVFSES